LALDEHPIETRGTASASSGPLNGLRILDLSTMIAAPVAATFLADLGADVVKVELPGQGDPFRGLPPHKDGIPLWWKVTNRNKRGITLDVRKPAGRELFERLLPNFDVLVENFRPGTLDKWGLDKEFLWRVKPGLTILRVSGFGQTGPYRERPGFARVFEALSGFTSICGQPGGPPLHVGFPIGDSIAGLFGAIGILSVLYRRAHDPEAPGEEIDVAATEAVFRLLDFLAIEHDQLGVVRGRSGNLSEYTAPSNIYRTADGHWASIAASTQSIFERLARAMGRPDLLADPRFAANEQRVRHREDIDAIVGQWAGSKRLDELREALDSAAVVFSPVYTIEDVFRDAQFAAREAIVSVRDNQLGDVRMQTVVPRFASGQAAIERAGPSLGEHNDEIYGDLLGIPEAERDRLHADGVI